MQITSKKENLGKIAAVKGKMDTLSAPEFDIDMNDWISQGILHFVIDFSELVYMSSCGLRSILCAERELKRSNGKVRNVFEISGLTILFHICDSTQEAMNMV